MLTIRPFRNDDENEVINLWLRCGLVHPQNDPRKDIRRKSKVRPDLFLVGTLQEKIVASVMVGYEGHRGWINYLAVDPDCRKRGFGRRMMDAAERLLRAEGCPKINLQVRTSNDTVVAFYRAMGFLPDDVVSLGKRLERDQKPPPISPCRADDFAGIHEIINEAAEAYRGVIPADRWHEPYMSTAELESEIAKGVRFYGYYDGARLIGVMGIQDVKDVTLIRHAYVRAEAQGRGVGGALLEFLRTLTERPVLIGTWKAASWAIGFYQKNGFVLVGDEEKNRLLGVYWTVPPRQIEESVVLADRRWTERS